MPGRSQHLRAPFLRRYVGASRYAAPLSVGITVATTLIVFFVTTDSLSGVKLLVTICIGLLGAALCLQLEMLVALAERKQSQDGQRSLLESLDEFPELIPLFTRLARAATITLRETKVEEFRPRVATVLGDSYVSLQELAEGRVRINGIGTALHARFGKATASLQGTTDEGDTVWWQRQSGREFFDLNRQLVARGIDVERVWLLSGAPDEATRNLINDHFRENIDVYLVRTDRVPAELLVNMTMMDEIFLYEDIPNKRGVAVEVLYTENEIDCMRAVARFAELKAYATRYESPATFDGLFSITGPVEAAHAPDPAALQTNG
jgi:hypothetical protein